MALTGEEDALTADEIDGEAIDHPHADGKIPKFVTCEECDYEVPSTVTTKPEFDSPDEPVVEVVKHCPMCGADVQVPGHGGLPSAERVYHQMQQES